MIERTETGTPGWQIRVDELNHAQDAVCRVALLKRPIDEERLAGWMDFAMEMYNILQDRINTITTPMTDKPFTED